MSLNIAVLGPGGVGGFVAAALSRSGSEVTVVARPETAGAIASGGLHVTSSLLGAFDADPVAVSELDPTPGGRPLDVLVVATKATGLRRGAGAGPRRAAGLVVPLLNGLEHMDVAARPLRQPSGSPPA